MPKPCCGAYFCSAWFRRTEGAARENPAVTCVAGGDLKEPGVSRSALRGHLAAPLSARVFLIVTLLTSNPLSIAQASEVTRAAPIVLPVWRQRPSECPSRSPAGRSLRNYALEGIAGRYVAFGDRRLLPTEIVVHLGPGQHRRNIDQILLGARTSISFAPLVSLEEQPFPISGSPVAPHAMADLLKADIKHNRARTSYAYEVTSSRWEIMGKRSGSFGGLICLYYERTR